MSSSLQGLLNIGSGALQAQQAGVAIAGKNAANVNTEGYSRQSVDFISELGSDGVRTGAAYRSDDPVLSLRERQSSGAQGRTQTLSTALAGLESSLTAHGADLVNAIANLFGGFIDLASAPSDPALRTAAVSKAQGLTQSFQRAAATVEQARSDSDTRLVSMAQQASSLTTQIAAANRALSVEKDPALADKRDQAAMQLAAITGGQARIDPDGKMRFVAAGGEVLVDGDRAASLHAAPDAAYGNHMKITVVDGNHVADVTTRLDGGTIAGEIGFRDGTAAQATQDLDHLAFDLATQMNAVHRQNSGLDGKSGRDLFTAPAAVTGAAASFSVSAGIVADPSTFAAAAPAAGRTDNTGVNALIALRDQNLAGGNARTFIEESIHTLAAIGSATQVATADHDLEKARGEVLVAARSSVSGVSTTEELAKLAQFQKAAEAAGNFINSVNTMMDYLLAKI